MAAPSSPDFARAAGPPVYGQPPPAYGYPASPSYGQPATPGPQTPVVTQQPIALLQMFRETPVVTRCPYCHADMVTAVHYETGTITWVACVVLFFFGCSLGCCFIPFCTNSCKNAVHTCPNCHRQVGCWNRM